MKKPFKYNPQDPRPEWMQEQQWATEGSSDRFREWARENLHIDIDKQLAYDQARGDQKAIFVLNCIRNNKPLMLHNGPKRFCIIDPRFNSIVTVYPGGRSEAELLKAKDFQNRIKMAYVFYPDFGIPSEKLILNSMELLLKKFEIGPKKPPKLLQAPK